MKLSSLLISFLLVAVVVLAYFTVDSHLQLDAINKGIQESSEAIPRESDFILERAEQAVGLAFNLLGMIEALSLAITIGGVIITVFGLNRFSTASNELEEARKLVERELEDARRRFDTAVAQREAVRIPKSFEQHLARAIVRKTQQPSIALHPVSRIGHEVVAGAIE